LDAVCTNGARFASNTLLLFGSWEDTKNPLLSTLHASVAGGVALGNVVATFETQLEYVRFLYFI